jgi:hypothetical protein
MKIQLIFIALALLTCTVTAQVNLAPNPSFEDYGTCPTFYSTVDVFTDTYVHD